MNTLMQYKIPAWPREAFDRTDGKKLSKLRRLFALPEQSKFGPPLRVRFVHPAIPRTAETAVPTLSDSLFGIRYSPAWPSGWTRRLVPPVCWVAGVRGYSVSLSRRDGR